MVFLSSTLDSFEQDEEGKGCCRTLRCPTTYNLAMRCNFIITTSSMLIAFPSVVLVIDEENGNMSVIKRERKTVV